MKRCGKLKHAILIEMVLILLLLAVRQAGGRPASVNSDSVLMEENAEEETGKVSAAITTKMVGEATADISAKAPPA